MEVDDDDDWGEEEEDEEEARVERQRLSVGKPLWKKSRETDGWLSRSRMRPSCANAGVHRWGVKAAASMACTYLSRRQIDIVTYQKDHTSK